MENKDFLNFTHGTTLQSFLREFLSAENAGDKTFPKWVVREQEKLRRTQPKLWSVTGSMECYYHYLEKLREILCQPDAREQAALLLEEVCGKTRSKVHALFLTQEPSCWPSLESLFSAAQRSDDYEASLVYTPFYHKNFSEQVDWYDTYRQMGLPVQRHNEYDLCADSPDVAFIIKPYASIPEMYQTPHLEQVVERIIYIPYGMEITTDLIQYGFQFYSHYRAWRHCAYGNVVKEYGTKFGFRNGENIAVWGHPKADHYRDMEKSKASIPEEWKQRIGSRKVILWSPHHLIDLTSNGTGTWLIWGEYILNEALSHPELFFILRPHPLMLGALVNSNAMTPAQVDALRARIDAAENILWDTNDTYHAAFNAADAIITDGTTFSIEFLYTKKPILLTPRNMEGFFMYRDMLDSYYIVNNRQDICAFMDMILAGEDPLREKRLSMYEKTFFIPKDCSVGEHILRQARAELTQECEDVNKYMTREQAKQDAGISRQANPEDYPLFSILVLCYKNQELLFDMLDSIFRQNYPRIELVVSDDGSEDFDVSVVQNYIDMHKRSNIERVVVRTNETNMRTVKHINLAMTHVTGEYLVFTAADARFTDPDVISAYVEQFLRHPQQNWLVAKCNMTTPDYQSTIYVTPTEKDLPYFQAGNAQKLFSRWSRRGMAIPCCMAFKRSAIEKLGGFDTDYLFLEDWPLVLKLLRTGNAPIFLDKISAIHSTGGITNSNARYGKEKRRLFYNDKYTIFRKEVKPYLHLLTKEDKKAYKQYMKEIMARHWFFYIDWPDTSLLRKLMLLITKPIRFWWLFEQKFMSIKDKLPKKLLLVGSQGLMLLSMLFLNADVTANPVGYLFRALGWVDLCVGLLLLLVGLVAYPLGKHFEKKAALRQDLVN